MREIKFRAWDSISNKMMEDVCSHNSKNFKVNEEKQQWFIMQFTGLKDKNGKEIYEGDIVEFAFDTGKEKRVIEWCNEKMSLISVNLYRLNEHWITKSNYSRVPIKDYSEVIGNIYENKELLNG